MKIKEHKDYLRYEKNARNLFLHCVQEVQNIVDRRFTLWNRLQFIETNLMLKIAGVSDSAKAILREAIQSAKGVLGTYEHNVFGSKVQVIYDADFDDAVRLILLILEEMDK